MFTRMRNRALLTTRWRFFFLVVVSQPMNVSRGRTSMRLRRSPTGQGSRYRFDEVPKLGTGQGCIAEVVVPVDVGVPEALVFLSTSSSASSPTCSVVGRGSVFSFGFFR